MSKCTVLDEECTEAETQSALAARIRVALKTHNNYYARSWLALKPRIVAFVYCSSWLLRRLAVKTSLSASKSVKWKPR